MDEQLPTLAAVLARIPDPQAARGRRHSWAALLLLMVVGILSGSNSQRAVARWGRLFGPRLQRVRVAWRRSAARWLAGIAIDGKVLRGARRLGAEDAYLLSASGQRVG